MRKIFTIALLLLILLSMRQRVVAQEVTFFSQFNAITDNREFFSPYSQAETIFGSNMAIGASLDIDTVQGVVMGISNFYEFGSSFLEQPFYAVLNYSYRDAVYDFKIGAFLRSDINSLPISFVSEKYSYYNPTVDGLYFNYQRSKFDATLLLDWVSRQDSVKREQFLVYLGSEQRLNHFILDESFYMFHNAHSLSRFPGESIEDYLGLRMLVGYDWSYATELSVLRFKSGVLASAARNRGESSDFSISPAWYSELILDYKGWGIETYLKIGKQQNFFLGDQFYNNADNYWRTNLYFTPIKFANVEGRFLWSFHVANGDLDNQQQFKLIYRFATK